MDNKIIQIIIGATLAIIVLGTALAPIISDVAADSKTFKNEGYFLMDVVNSDEEFTATFDKASPKEIIINGESINIDFDYSSARSLMAGDNWCLRASLYQGQMLIQFFSGTSNVSAGVDADSMTIVNNGGTLTATNSNSDTRSVEFESFYTISNNGDYVMKYSDKSAYMLNESVFVGVGLTSGSSAVGIVGLNVTGDMGDVTITPWRGTDLTFSNIVISKSVVNGYIDLNKFDKVTFTVTDGESDSLDITYSYVIVPLYVTADVADPIPASHAALYFAIIPLMVVAILMMIVGVLRSKY